MTDHFQAQRPRSPYNDDLDNRKKPGGVAGWVWAVIFVVVSFLVCSGVMVGGAMFYMLLRNDAAPSPAPPPPIIQPLPPDEAMPDEAP